MPLWLWISVTPSGPTVSISVGTVSSSKIQLPSSGTLLGTVGCSLN